MTININKVKRIAPIPTSDFQKETVAKYRTLYENMIKIISQNKSNSTKVDDGKGSILVNVTQPWHFAKNMSKWHKMSLQILIKTE